MYDMKLRISAANASCSRILLNVIVHVFATALSMLWYRVRSPKSVLMMAVASCSVFFKSRRYSEMELLLVLTYSRSAN